MPLTHGTRLGPYEIQSALGAGGMGEVYKARDTRLDRTVAIKVLPPHVASDPSFRQRFEREAKTISSLDHPHICALYDIGQDHGTDFLVMQYLDGETLADRLAKGPLPLGQALKHALEIADALDKAHRQGIVHRDLKPGNVMLTKAGAKLLDFGLAKAATFAAGVPAATMTGGGPVTAEGTILGTLQYMAPEQLEGQEADARSDIWAFGCVLYEMVTGRRAFESRSQASLMAAILEHEPAAVSQVVTVAPAALDHLIGRCLTKDPDERWASVHDVLLELKWIGDGAAPTPPAGSREPAPLRMRRSWTAWLAVPILLLAGAALATLVMRRGNDPQPLPVRFTIAAPKSTKFFDAPNFMSVAPDGRYVAFATRGSDSAVRLWLRPIDSLTARPIGDSAVLPFWSPDSRYIAFMTPGALKKVDLQGGRPVTLAQATSGGSWSTDGTILFTRAGVLYQVPAAGGEARQVTTLDATREETAHLWPEFLPDGRRFIFHVRSVKPEHQGLYLGSLDSTERTRISDAASSVAYASGYVLFARQRTLMAQPIDERTGRLTGEPITVAATVQQNPENGKAAFSVSRSGILAYRESTAPGAQLTLVDRNGAETAVGPTMLMQGFDVSPDGRYIVVAGRLSVDSPVDLHLIDSARGVVTTFTAAREGEFFMDPVWAPDGRTVAYTKLKDGKTVIASRPAFGGDERKLFEDKDPAYLEDWSRDGKYIAVTVAGGGHRGLVVPVGGGEPLVVGRSSRYFDEMSFSPDGRWLAYDSNESDRSDVYVVPVPPTGERFQVSPNGGVQPRWRANGRELTYLAPDGTIMVTPIISGPRFEVGVPRPLLKTRIDQPSAYEEQYRMLPDGQRFLLKLPVSEDQPLTVVLNWLSGIAK
jgi:Tol biopolymer transport system component/predicted Ser/Thr protein kinase